MSKIIYQGDVVPRPAALASWERVRHSKPVHWFIECFAEMLGVFIYTYLGVASTAAYTIGTLISEPGIGSLLTIGLAYGFGVVLSLLVASATSGGHFSPGVTITFMIFKKFPVIKGLRYIVFQILGGYIACLLVYAQYHDIIVPVELGLMAKKLYDVVQFTAQGPAGIFALYPPANPHWGRVFVNEFVVDIFLGLVIWAVLDPSNLLVPPPMGPWAIGFAYATAIWGFSVNGLAANTARDLGGRFAAMTIWGTRATGPANYAAIAALTNILAFIIAATIYEIFLTDSDRVLTSAALEFGSAHRNHGRNPARHQATRTSSEEAVHEKAHDRQVEHA